MLHVRSSRGLLAVTLALAAATAAAPTAATSDGDVVVIGHLAHLTGADAGPYGIPFDEGLQLGVEAVNASGLLGDITLELQTRDVGSEIPAAVTQFNQFVRSGVTVLVSPSSTPIQRALAPLVEEEGAVLLSASVGDESKTEPGGVFALGDVATPSETFGRYAVTEAGRSRAVIIVDGDNPAFVGIADNFRIGFEAEGGEILEQVGVSATDSDFSPVLTRVAAQEPELVYFATRSETAGNLITQMEQFDVFENTLYGGGISWQQQVFDTAGPAAAGSEFAVYWAGTVDGSSAFEQAFTARYDKAPQTWNALGYQSAWLIAGAVSAAVVAGDELDGATLAGHLLAVGELPMVQENGSFSEWGFRPSGLAQYPGAVVTFTEDGAIVPVG